MENFLNLPENFKFENIRSGDLYADASISNVLYRQVISFYTHSIFMHSGIFVWIDGNKYSENKTIKVISNKINEKSILCLLHQSFLGKKNLNLLNSKNEYGFILEPIINVLKRIKCIYCRKLSERINGKYLEEKIKSFFTSCKNYDKPDGPNVIASIVTGNILHQKKGFTCVHAVTSFYVEILNYPYGLDDIECKMNNFKIPEKDYSILEVKDFFYENNKSPIFEDEKEFEVYKSIDLLEYLFINPTVLSFIIICISLIIIFLIFFFHNKIPPKKIIFNY